LVQGEKESIGYWKEATFDTISLLLAVIVGIWEQNLLADNPLLLSEIGSVLVLIVGLTLRFVSRYGKSIATKFVKSLLQGMTWITAILAGNLFSYGYALVVAYPRIGIIGPAWFVVFLVFVLVLIRMIKVQQYRLKKHSNPGSTRTN
jgi:hypothetical protein